MQSQKNDDGIFSDKTELLKEIESLRKRVDFLCNRPPQTHPRDIIDNAFEWIKEVERVSTLAHWSNELKLTNAISRLSGSAKNWQLTTGKNFNDWTVWKTAFASRYKRRITMQEFLAHQSERKMKHSETLVDYIYAKYALLEKTPFTIPQEDRISIIGDVTEEKWQIALVTPNSDTVEELVDRATSLDAIRTFKQENKKQSSGPQLRSFSAHNVHLHKDNPTTDNIQDINCWRCGRKDHASFICHLSPPPRGSSVVKPNQFQELSSQANVLLSSSGSINHGNNTQRCTTNLNSSDSRRNSNSNRNSTSRRYATTNPTLCDPCSDITIIQQSCIPADAVIHPWTDGQFQVVDYKINPIGRISLNLSVGNIVHTMPKVEICTHLPFPLILGFNWQQQVQARCTYDSNGALCISTPSLLHLCECIHASKPSMNCIASNIVSLPPLEDVVLPDLNTKILSSQAQLIPNLCQTIYNSTSSTRCSNRKIF
ncbi:putative gypsy-29-i dr [Trichonephila clavipes]|nr:putative gypsy-29-i dr [Trichonephila clavipes]